MAIGDLFIPGTHNSGSYSEELPPTILQRYTVTQDRSVLDQLISGARYLDIRPCIHDNEYWVCHGTFKMQPLDQILQDIKEFMKNTDEIVIVSFKEFPLGFYSVKDYIEFLTFISKELEAYRYKSTFVQKLTLGDFWSHGKRLILSYRGRINHDSHYLWARILQEWGNVRSIPELYAYINRAENRLLTINREHFLIDCLRAVMAEVTLDSSMIIADAAAYYFGQSRKSLREFGVEAGPLITGWYNDDHSGSANIVAVDFIDASGIVELAIRSNLMRAENPHRR
ncbi:PI-PLC X domain-containing protein 2-like [Microplitis mediator]|uniref:PI-PLC X domain-containing protein 2-like n=1 Tax=Microplitis mediator TaxID=375433 RepID=UPI0025555C40|nr:PI-PLC X domain-containing protein 2-like [Microplitis mediator]